MSSGNGPSTNPNELVEHLDREDLLQRGMAHLTPDQREALVLRIIHGLSAEETAEVMGKSRSAVKNLQYRALLALRHHLSTMSQAEGHRGVA